MIIHDILQVATCYGPYGFTRYSDTKRQMAHRPDLTPTSETESVFPHYDLMLGLELLCCINIVSYLSRRCTSRAALL